MYTIEASVPSLRAKDRLTRLLSTEENRHRTDAQFLSTKHGQNQRFRRSKFLSVISVHGRSRQQDRRQVLLTTTVKTSSLGGRTTFVLFSGDVSSSLSSSKIHLRSDFRAGQKLQVTLFFFSHHFVIGTSLTTS